MDPDANLNEQLELASWLLDHDGDLHQEDAEYKTKGERLAELVVALDEWLCNRGAKPKTWLFQEPAPRPQEASQELEEGPGGESRR